MLATLILEDGSVYKGEQFGACGTKIGEIVFNTSMTGYQEILTDPSYANQIIIMTYPEIGNYGINEEDFESYAPKCLGFVVKKNCKNDSHYKSKETLSNYLERNGVIGIEGIDTRSLVIKIREKGTMRCLQPMKLKAKAKLLKKSVKFVRITPTKMSYCMFHRKRNM